MKNTMMRKLGLALLIAMLGVGLAACEEEQGPAEEAGENIDESMDEMGEEMEEAGEEMEETAEDAQN
ncbi:hypothetical protein [Halomonas rhizosphaerae]|uniref:YtxH domain-containing protein n=1 Tax=Halomonas rhizosphaerae TaxID=3043296 RepID=A0ABT6UXQ0_9GAMM|nr:hypothetical protein [Halomonas rhizosphaerae]MDI5890013.1 hypothetical protein [Halomonas rhizosphaerae]MDI5919644.1 hypothetical protein [Halomonas rhizosphaerae]